jgi:G6PDH family F420-dependent oxidoreductase
MISDHVAPWVPRQGESGFVWSVLGAIATATDALRIGTGVTAPIHRMHPFVIAHAAATVEALMPGRFFLGLGTGERLNEAPMGRPWPPPRERRDMLCEAVDLIRTLWSGGVVSRTTEHFRLDRAQLFSLPAVPPPIVMAATSTAGARVAGEIADGLLTTSSNPELVSALELAGGDKATMVQLHVCWADDDDSARRTIREWWPNGGIPGPLVTELARPAEFDALVGALDDETLDGAVISGPDPEPYLAAIRRAVGAGFRTVYLHQVGPDQAGFLDFSRSILRPAFAQ